MKKLTSIEITDAFRIIRHRYRHGYPTGIKKPRRITYNLVRVACNWLDAQSLDDDNHSARYDLEEIISDWCGIPVPAFCIIIAAELLPDVKGEYPCYNLCSTLITPSVCRLDGLYLNPTSRKSFQARKE